MKLMSDAPNRPTIFLSSTIYDFRDLRSALKHHLEVRGCDVLASEYNDFTKPYDRHSYQACLDSIAQADLFILFIGSRVGGWYDHANHESITQKEYRTAYSLAQQGKLRLLSFVRAEVWNFRENIKSLEEHIKSMAELNDESRNAIKRYPNKFATDAEFIVSFIDEVTRNKETAAAVRGNGAFPIGNWVHPFNSFSEVVQVVDPLILRGRSVTEAANLKALQSQLLALLRGTLTKVKNRAVLPRVMIEKLAINIGLNTSSLRRELTLAEKDWNSLVTLALLTLHARADYVPFRDVLASSVLLQYDPVKGAFDETTARDALAALVDQIRLFDQAKSGSDFAKLAAYGLRRNERDKSVSVPTVLVAGQLQLFFRWIDMIEIAKALLQWVDGQPLTLPRLMPPTPFADQAAEVKNEQVTMDEVRAFVRGTKAT
jgi:Domain of unknown function (DUF4062)